MAEAIDSHTHFVPRNIPAEPGHNPLWPSIELRGADGAAVMVGGKVFRVIDSRSWDGRRRIDDMAADDVDVQVISPMPELLSHWFPPDDADALGRHINEGIAELCAAHPGRFIGIGMVPMQDVTLAVKRLDEIRSFGLRGIEIGTHINGVPLGDARLRDVYAAAEQAGFGRAPRARRGRCIPVGDRLRGGVANDEWHHRAVSEAAVAAQPWWRSAAVDLAAVAACKHRRTAFG